MVVVQDAPRAGPPGTGRLRAAAYLW